MNQNSAADEVAPLNLSDHYNSLLLESSFPNSRYRAELRLVACERDADSGKPLGPWNFMIYVIEGIHFCNLNLIINDNNESLFLILLWSEYKSNHLLLFIVKDRRCANRVMEISYRRGWAVHRPSHRGGTVLDRWSGFLGQNGTRICLIEEDSDFGKLQKNNYYDIPMMHVDWID